MIFRTFIIKFEKKILTRPSQNTTSQLKNVTLYPSSTKSYRSPQKSTTQSCSSFCALIFSYQSTWLFYSGQSKSLINNSFRIYETFIRQKSCIYTKRVNSTSFSASNYFQINILLLQYIPTNPRN
ncbi:hypothetical protein IMG5_167010 [Ichthyophthirius multifiliis]|uniref:Uncharacterized protein n=1 Tax=Ichthyophthirius multifiliis TaxID=5932 RepID=G0R0U7_ICHMU|nr:hypothetical protein IMG5_167010 [Ichthyophthirius multifiliis]EGR28907.1 hypothetical protein IMG5_167010 [Ichthyophthirius multifiliis]|eukprot:XP_004030143.1 hypothetical protein IMG5_167010 [Ichthyophthirius multifiliis]